MQQEISLLCNQCPTCQGFGCIGQMPGMGGVNNNKNFQLNCQGWHLLRGHAKKAGTYDALKSISVNEKNIYIAPVTGAVQNIGYKNEKDFYTPYITAAYKAGVGIALGDGIPDEKLQFGIQAVKDLQKVLRQCKQVRSLCELAITRCKQVVTPCKLVKTQFKPPFF